MARLAKRYRSWDPQAYALLNYSPAQQLPEGDLVFFLIDLIPQLDLSEPVIKLPVWPKGRSPSAERVTGRSPAPCWGRWRTTRQSP